MTSPTWYEEWTAEDREDYHEFLFGDLVQTYLPRGGTYFEVGRAPGSSMVFFHCSSWKLLGLHAVRRRATPDNSFMAGFSELETEYTSNLSARCSIAGRNGSTASDVTVFKLVVMCNEGRVWPLIEALLNTTPSGRGVLFRGISS